MGFLEKFTKGLTKTRDFFKQGIEKISTHLGYFDEDMLDELEELLILSDFGMPASQEIMQNLRKSMKESGNRSKEYVLRILRENMEKLLGEQEEQSLLLPEQENRQLILLMVGVNGTGKTTSAGKLAYLYKKAGKSVLLAAADTFRAAAIEQLESWAERVGVDFLKKEQGSDPASVVFDALAKAKTKKYDVLLIDTAGRLHNKKNLMDELAKMRRIISRENPEAEVLSILVLDATTGQNAVLQAKYFHEICSLDKLILTKLDGNSKGGVVFAVRYELPLPLWMTGLGEDMEDLVPFNRNDFITSILENASHMEGKEL